jgi:large subunit ribosomal protein L4
VPARAPSARRSGVGGGVALGPKPRKYAQRTPKKMIRLALRSALSDRAAEGKVIVVDDWGFDTPSTKAAIAALERPRHQGRVLVVLDRRRRGAAKSFRNLPQVHVSSPASSTPTTCSCNDWVVFTRDTLPTRPRGQRGGSREGPPRRHHRARS